MWELAHLVYNILDMHLQASLPRHLEDWIANDKRLEQDAATVV